MNSTFQVKTRVWFQDQPLSWTEGEIFDVLEGGKKIVVATASGNVSCAAEHVFLRNEQRLEMADNLKDLVYLDEPNVS
jgi:hypothetical protein